jgi:hypothetical protein
LNSHAKIGDNDIRVWLSCAIKNILRPFKDARLAADNRINQTELCLLQITVDYVMVVQILNALQDLSNNVDSIGFGEFAPLSDALEQFPTHRQLE